jgi:hypothetical protein
MTAKDFLQFQIEHYTNLAITTTNPDYKDEYLSNVRVFKNKLADKIANKPHNPIAWDCKNNAQFKGSFFSLN